MEMRLKMSRFSKVIKGYALVLFGKGQRKSVPNPGTGIDKLVRI